MPFSMLFYATKTNISFNKFFIISSKPSAFHIETSLTYNSKNEVAFRYSYYSNYFTSCKIAVNQIMYRKMHYFELGYSYNHIIGKFLLKPFFSIAARPSGIEGVFLGYIPGSWNELVISSFDYNSFGFSSGAGIRRLVFNNIYLKFDFRYNYFYEKNKLLGKPHRGFEEFYKDYQVNREFINFSLGIGYRIGLRK